MENTVENNVSLPTENTTGAANKKRRILLIAIASVVGVLLLGTMVILANTFLFNVKRDGVHYKWVRGGYCVVGYEGEGGDVVIEETLNKRPVIAIGEYAFENQVTITSVTVPNSVKSMGFGAFDDCMGLVSLTLPFVGDSASEPTYTHIGYLFGGPDHRDNDCVMPRTLVSVTVTGEAPLGAAAFLSCRYLTDVTLGDGVSAVGNSAFESCIALVSVSFGKGVTAIGEAAFAGCTALVEIDLPDAVERLENATFKDCSSLQTVWMPENLKFIGTSVFYECTVLAEFEIPAGVVSIDTFAFRNCRRIRKLVLPASLERISAFAFEGCRYLRDVTFEGDAQWRISGSERVFVPLDGSEAAAYLRDTYLTESWRRVD